jgi:uncharacterized FlaG/YvyC family protein
MNVSSISNLASHLSAATPAAQPKPQPTPDQTALLQSVKAAVKTVNDAQLFGQDNEVTFRIDRAVNIAVVRVINKQTGELVQQIPNEQMLKLAEESSGR